MNTNERGAVSIFLVIFFALLLSVITMSFIGIVIRDATQSTNNDLSRSAYDSAEAGVEDAKRAIAAYTNACTDGDGNCSTYQNALSQTNCSALHDLAGNLGLQTGTGNEIKVQNTGADNNLNQAETCVNIALNTPDYINSEQAYQSDIIPLTSTADFNGITLQWFTHTDAGTADTTPFTPRAGNVSDLPPQDSWGGNSTPALLRLELIAYPTGSSFTDSDLNNAERTIFLYPSNGARDSSFPPRDATHSTVPSAPTIVAAQCMTSGIYACTSNVSLGDLGSSHGRTMFLRVTPVYKKTTFRVQLSGAGTVDFAGVQPIVDSTGRANDLFRRVQARVRLENSVLYPEFAADDQGSFCKNFSVGTDPVNDFVNYCH